MQLSTTLGYNILDTQKDNIQISILNLFHHITDAQSKVYNSSKLLRELTFDCQSEYSQNGKSEKYGNLKKGLNWFTLTGYWEKGHKKSNFTGYNGIAQIDIDKLSEEQLNAIKNSSFVEKYCLLGFVSPSGLGFKFFVKTNNTEKSAHTQYVDAINQEISKELDLPLSHFDTLNYSQVCYTSFDKEAIFNNKSSVFNFTPFRVKATKKIIKNTKVIKAHTGKINIDAAIDLEKRFQANKEHYLTLFHAQNYSSRTVKVWNNLTIVQSWKEGGKGRHIINFLYDEGVLTNDIKDGLDGYITYVDVNIDKYINDAAKDVILREVKESNIILQGAAGCGKTTLNKEIGGDFAAPYRAIVLQTAEAMNITANVGRKSIFDKKAASLKTCSSYELTNNNKRNLLFIDEAHNLNAEYRERTMKEVDDIILSRYNNTILASATPSKLYAAVHDFKIIRLISSFKKKIIFKGIESTPSDIFANITSNLKKDAINFIYLNNKAKCKELDSLLKKRGFIGHVVTSEERGVIFEKVTKTLLLPECNYIISTAIFKEGVNINNKNINLIEIGNNSAKDKEQLISRFRKMDTLSHVNIFQKKKRRKIAMTLLEIYKNWSITAEKQLEQLEQILKEDFNEAWGEKKELLKDYLNREYYNLLQIDEHLNITINYHRLIVRAEKEYEKQKGTQDIINEYKDSIYLDVEIVTANDVFTELSDIEVNEILRKKEAKKEAKEQAKKTIVELAKDGKKYEEVLNELQSDVKKDSSVKRFLADLKKCYEFNVEKSFSEEIKDNKKLIAVENVSRWLDAKRGVKRMQKELILSNCDTIFKGGLSDKQKVGILKKDGLILNVYEIEVLQKYRELRGKVEKMLTRCFLGKNP